MRRLLIEAAWQGIRRSPQIRARFERIDADGVRTALDPEEHPALFSELVSSWESLKLARARPRDP